jgi:hypothetical protein
MLLALLMGLGLELLGSLFLAKGIRLVLKFSSAAWKEEDAQTRMVIHTCCEFNTIQAPLACSTKATQASLPWCYNERWHIGKRLTFGHQAVCRSFKGLIAERFGSTFLNPNILTDALPSIRGLLMTHGGPDVIMAIIRVILLDLNLLNIYVRQIH